MKKTLYIVSFFSLSILIGCQKSDLENTVEAKVSNSKKVESQSMDVEEGIVPPQPVEETSSSNTPSPIDIDTNDDDMIGFIKEVSDGDDEADGGDDSQVSN